MSTESTAMGGALSGLLAKIKALIAEGITNAPAILQALEAAGIIPAQYEPEVELLVQFLLLIHPAAPKLMGAVRGAPEAVGTARVTVLQNHKATYDAAATKYDRRALCILAFAHVGALHYDNSVSAGDLGGMSVAKTATADELAQSGTTPDIETWIQDILALLAVVKPAT